MALWHNLTTPEIQQLDTLKNNSSIFLSPIFFVFVWVSISWHISSKGFNIASETVGEQKTWRGESEVEEIDEGASPALRIMGAQVTGGDWRLEIPKKPCQYDECGFQ